ncbi:MAG: hypothetical protein ACP5UZ_05960 [Thermoplasmata archaeon]
MAIIAPAITFPYHQHWNNRGRFNYGGIFRVKDKPPRECGEIKNVAEESNTLGNRDQKDFKR